MTFDDAVAEYLGSTPNRNTERDRYSLNRLAPHFSGRELISIRRVHIRGYIASRLRDGVKPATINRELDLFSAAWNYVCFTYELDLRNPARKMSLEEPEGRLRWLTREEADRFIAAAWRLSVTPVLPCFIVVALNTGCRKSELLKLEWPRVDLRRSYLRLDGEHTKTRRRRLVPLNGAAVDALDRLRSYRIKHCPESRWVFARPDGGRVTTIWKRFEAAKEAAEIRDFRIHDLRHTFASWLVMSGVSLYVVRDLLGHSSIQMTERYAHLAPEQLSSAVQLLLRFQA